MNGFGIKKWADGTYMKGHWKDGLLYGKGEKHFGTDTRFAGDTYVGEFDEKGFSGFGIYYGKRLDFIQKGNWKDMKPNGYGEVIFKSLSTNPGWSYTGDWVNGKKTGFGTLHMGTKGSHAGIEYVGFWLNDKMQGKGIYTWPDGSKYIGEFANDTFEGSAKFIFSDDVTYVGVWSDGSCPGFLKILADRSKVSKDRDSVLTKFFYRKDR